VKFFAFHSLSGTLPETIRPFKKKHKNKKSKKKSIKKKRRRKGGGKEEGLSQLFFFTKLTIQSQKKINFLMHLHCKNCKEGATVVTQFWPIGF